AFRPADYTRFLDDWRPEVIGFSLNYLANVPEVIDLAREAKHRLPACRVVVGGHSASFVAEAGLAGAGGAVSLGVGRAGGGGPPGRGGRGRAGVARGWRRSRAS